MCDQRIGNGAQSREQSVGIPSEFDEDRRHIPVVDFQGLADFGSFVSD